MTNQEALEYFSLFARNILENGDEVADSLDAESTADSILCELQLTLSSMLDEIKRLRAEDY